MKVRGSCVASMAVAALLLGPVVGAALGQDYNKDIRGAQSQLQKRQYPQALKALDALLKKYKEPAQLAQIQQYRIDCHLATKKFDAALADAGKLQKDFAQDKNVQIRALSYTGQALRGQKKFPEAVAAYRKLAKDYVDFGDPAAEALLTAGDIYCNDLKKFPEALVAYAEVEKTFAALLPKAAEAARRAAVTHETLTKDLVKASGFYQSLAVKYASAYKENIRAGHFTKAVDCLQNAAKLPEAQAVAAKAEKALETTARKTPFAIRQADLLMAQKKWPQARAECERIICAYPLQQAVCQGIQKKIVETHRAESKFAETLGAARSLYDAAGSENDIRAAAHVVAQAFRSVDGNLGRANEFLVYQRFGPTGPDAKPNTADDVKANHLATAKYPPTNPVRDKLFTAAVAAQPNTFQGYRAKGFLYAYWGRPKESAQQFRLALRACTDAQVPQAANELVLIGMKAHRASFHGLDQIFEYISYGPKGKTGKANIPDPFRGL